jgi:ABC-type transport system involved in multi-copper enzyme maturation permease subunit
MKNIGTLYRFEMRKILSRKLTWVLLAFILMYCIRIIVSISISYAITIEYTNERGTLTSAFFTYKEIFFKSREAARTIAGQPMEDAFFAEMGKSVPYFDENELAYFLLQDATYLHAYEMVDGLVENPRTITAEDFYSALEMVRERMWDKELTDSEIDYWREQVSKIDTPFIYNRYWVAMPLLLDFFYRLLDLLPLAAAVCLCTIFSEDRNMRVEALVFSSKNSRRPLFMAKMLAGITGALLIAVLIIGTTLTAHFVIWGTEGLDAAIQMFDITSGLPIKVFHVILAQIIWLIALTMIYAGVTMLTSVLTRSGIASFLIPIALMMFVSDFINPASSRITDYLPENLVGWGTENCRLVNLFGVQMNCLQFAPLLYGGIAVILLILCGFGWRRIVSDKK